MSLSTQLSVDFEATWHDKDLEMDSEDWVLSQVAIKILNKMNNTKGEERNGPCPSQRFFIVVELNRTRYGVKFLNENLIFCPLQDEPLSKGASSSDACTRAVLNERSQIDIPITNWSIQYPYQETQLHPGEYSGPPYNAVDPSIKLQEGYYQNPSITAEQTILSSSVNLERKGSFDSFNPSNLSYPKQSINTSLIGENPQPNYSQHSYLSQIYTEPIDFFDSSFIQQNGEFDRFEFFYDSPCTRTDTTNVHR